MFVSKCHIVGNHMLGLNYVKYPPISQLCLTSGTRGKSFCLSLYLQVRFSAAYFIR